MSSIFYPRYEEHLPPPNEQLVKVLESVTWKTNQAECVELTSMHTVLTLATILSRTYIELLDVTGSDMIQ
jgi:hypothetical protein